MSIETRDALDASRLLDVREVERLTSLKKVTLLRQADRGKFPRPLVLIRETSGKPRKLAWRAVEVQDWIAARERAA